MKSKHKDRFLQFALGLMIVCGFLFPSVVLAASDTDLHRAVQAGDTKKVSQLLDAGADINAEGRFSERPLHYAVKKGNFEMVRLLVKRGAELEVRNHSGKYPLTVAIRGKKVEIAIWLLDQGADYKKSHALHHAVEYQQTKLIRELLKKGADVNGVDRLNRTPMFHVLSSYAVDPYPIAQLLFAHGARMDIKGRDGYTDGFTVLHRLSCSRALTPELIELFLKHGADPNAQMENGDSPLHRASKINCLKLAKPLVEAGANPNTKGFKGRTPLHQAVQRERGHLELVDYLLAKGADPKQADSFGVTSLHWNAQFGNSLVTSSLLTHGARVDARDRLERTPLHWCAESGDYDVCWILVREGADVIAKNKYGETPLHLASSKGFDELVELFLSKGADVSAKNNRLQTPLHLAARSGADKNVDLLIQAGAPLNILTQEGWTPLDLAKFLGQEKTALFLSKRGAKGSGRSAPWLERVPENQKKEIKEISQALSTVFLSDRSSAFQKIEELDLKPSVMIPLLTMVMENGDQPILENMVYFFERFGPESKGMVPALLKMMEDKAKNARARLFGPKTLGSIGVDSPLVLPALIQILGDPLESDHYYRFNALMAIEKLGNKARLAEVALLKLAQEHPSKKIRIPAWIIYFEFNPKHPEALRKVREIAEGHHGNRVSLNSGVTSTSFNAISWAMRALYFFGEREHLITACIKALSLEPESRAQAGVMLGAIGPEGKKAVPALFQALNGESTGKAGQQLKMYLILALLSVEPESPKVQQVVNNWSTQFKDPRSLKYFQMMTQKPEFRKQFFRTRFRPSFGTWRPPIKYNIPK
jgi:ankyrin repeat protein